MHNKAKEILKVFQVLTGAHPKSLSYTVHAIIRHQASPDLIGLGTRLLQCLSRLVHKTRSAFIQDGDGSVPTGLQGERCNAGTRMTTTMQLAIVHGRPWKPESSALA